MISDYNYYALKSVLNSGSISFKVYPFDMREVGIEAWTGLSMIQFWCDQGRIYSFNSCHGTKASECGIVNSKAMPRFVIAAKAINAHIARRESVRERWKRAVKMYRETVAR